MSINFINRIESTFSAELAKAGQKAEDFGNILRQAELKAANPDENPYLTAMGMMQTKSLIEGQLTTASYVINAFKQIMNIIT